MSKVLYFDQAATSHVHPKVLSHLVELYQKGIANSASLHRDGVEANILLEKSREKIARTIGATSEEIFFTSGATESNNLILKGALADARPGDEILVSSIDHSSVLQVAHDLSKRGIVVKIIPVETSGMVNLIALDKLISAKTRLISIGHGNNEIGVIQNLAEVANRIAGTNIFFHSDGAQSFAKVPFDVKKLNLSAYSMSAHKIHGPKGIGAFYLKSGSILSPLLHGGKQEGGLRAGTVAVELASAMGVACELYDEKALADLNFKHNVLKEKLQTLGHCIRFNGGQDSLLPTIINVAFPNRVGKNLLRELDKCGVRISVGSACQSGQKSPSHVLKAIGQSDSEAYEAIRLSIGLSTTVEEIEQLIDHLKTILSMTNDE